MQDQTESHQRKKKIIRFLYLLFIGIIISVAILFSRGPHISNILKKAILPELEAALQQKVIAKKIYINIFPLFIEVRDIKVFDENGTRMLSAEMVKGYIEPLGLLQKRISIHRLVIKKPNLSSDRQRLAKTIENVKAYLAKESKFPFKVRIKVVEVSEASASLQDQDLQSSIDIRGLRSEVILGKTPKLSISTGQFDIKKKGLPEFTGDVTAAILLRQNVIEIKRLTIGSYGSRLRVSGLYSDGNGTFKVKIALLVDSVRSIFNLQQKGEGKISAEGEIRVENLQNPDLAFNKWDDIFIDLRLKGDFYIQTLMEILKVKEKVEGLTDFQGEMKGKLSDISGEAEARLRKANLFGVEIDSLRCNVTYKDGLMKFTKGDAELYNGRAKAEASIDLPRVSSFTLNIKFDSIDSKDAFKLIGWDPGIPVGKAKGELLTSGSRFNPDGWFVYEALSKKQRESTGNVLDRVKDVNGAYSLRGDLLSLSDLRMKTPLSDLRAEGRVDIAKRTIGFTCALNTKDTSDLTLPYYAKLTGQGNYSGKITGTFDNPGISGRADLSGVSIQGYRAANTTLLFSYNKKLLSVRELLVTAPGEEHRAKGKILFPEAKDLFDFSKPIYDLNVSIKTADLGGVMQLFSKEIPARGRVSADFKIRGKDKIEIDGDAYIIKSSIYKIPIDSSSIAFSYFDKELSFKKVVVKQGTSMLTAEGKISSDEKFFFRASSNKILIKDFGLENIPEGTSISIQSEGQGSLKDPVIVLNAKVIGGAFRGKSVGDSFIKGEIKSKNISLNASFFDERIKFRGEGHLDNILPWKAEVEIQPGRYDFLLGAIFTDAPEDMILNLRGHVQMEGDRHNVRASADISNLALGLLDYSFTNDSDIKVRINNGNISFPAFSMRSGGASSVKVLGGLDIGREYNLRLEGRSSLSPLKALSGKLEHLTGESEFAFSIRGKWENPDIKGDLAVSNASLGLKGDFPRISSINASASIDEDKFVLKKFSGKIGGGEINASGLIHIKGFHIKRFSFESNLNNITASFVKDSMVNFNGNLVYKGTPEAQGISGDIKIKSAKYKRRVEWKSWLLKTRTLEKPRAGLSGLEKAQLNISIAGEENIFIDNNVARTPVRVDMIVRGTVSQPGLFGRLESKEGVFYFRNNEFKIVHASADFADPNRVNPVIELSAETSVKGYQVKLNLEGQIDHFNLSLSSDPPLEEPDIFSLLTVGEVGKDLKGLKGGIGAGEATSFLAGTLQDVFEERLKMVTGFDRIQVGSSVSKTSGTVEPRVTVSKRLLSDKVFVTYSNILGSTTTGEQIFRIEYLLDKNISLIGTSDERGIMGGDIKFRFEFK
jgi:autotransporter translocation and assembly factor TamB